MPWRRRLTPGLRLDHLQLRPGGRLVVLPDLPPHAEAQRHHVVLLAVGGQAAPQVVQQRRLQPGALRGGGSRGHADRRLTARGRVLVHPPAVCRRPAFSSAGSRSDGADAGGRTRRSSRCSGRRPSAAAPADAMEPSEDRHGNRRLRRGGGLTSRLKCSPGARWAWLRWRAAWRTLTMPSMLQVRLKQS